MTVSRSLVPPQFSIPPSDYNQSYFADTLRAFSVFVLQAMQPGEGRATRLTLTALPNNDVGLEAGALFQHDGYVKISRLTHPNPQGSSGTGAVGSVTVTIS